MLMLLLIYFPLAYSDKLTKKHKISLASTVIDEVKYYYCDKVKKQKLIYVKNILIQD